MLLKIHTLLLWDVLTAAKQRHPKSLACFWPCSLQEQSRGRLCLRNCEATCPPGSSISLELPTISPTSAVSNLKKVTIISILISYSPEDNLYVLSLQLVLMFISLRPWSPTLWLLCLSFQQLLGILYRCIWDFLTWMWKYRCWWQWWESFCHEVWGGERCRMGLPVTTVSWFCHIL